MEDQKLALLDRYDPSWAMTPFWQGDTVYNESVVLIPDENGVMRAPVPGVHAGGRLHAGR